MINGVDSHQQADLPGGYETASETVDPKSFAFLNEYAETVQQQILHRSSKNRWHARRYKKFPRFSIYLQRDKTNSYLERNYISLNNKMLEFLAEQDPEAPQQTVVEDGEESIASSIDGNTHEHEMDTHEQSLAAPTE